MPFIDVLPNYVGPVEHLRTFGWFSPLSATQSPIIGPSRTVLGYDGLLGALATMTNLSGGLAIAGVHPPADGPRRRRRPSPRERAPRAATRRSGRGRSSPSRSASRSRGSPTRAARSSSCRSSASGWRSPPRRFARPDGRRAEPSASDARPVARSAAAPSTGLALGAATLVHPVIGFFAVVTVAIAGLCAAARARRARRSWRHSPRASSRCPSWRRWSASSLPTLVLGVWLPPRRRSALPRTCVGPADEGAPAVVRLARAARARRSVLLVAALAGVAPGHRRRVREPGSPARRARQRA